jgi:hypothetical protein
MNANPTDDGTLHGLAPLRRNPRTQIKYADQNEPAIPLLNYRFDSVEGARLARSPL